MILAITIAAVLVSIFLIAVAIRTFQRERWALYIVIPALLAFAAGSGHAINAMLGYPTGDLSDLQYRFLYMHHSGEDPVFLLAVPEGANAPRLYRIPAHLLNEQSRRGFADAEAKAAKNVPVVGSFAEGEFVQHDIRADGLPPKN